MTIDDKTEPITANSVRLALGTIAGKWKPFILLHLIDEDLRYGRLRQAIPAISEKVLIQQLKELKKDGLVVRTAYPQWPPRVEYGLTAYGRTLRPLLALLSVWGSSHGAHQAQVEQEGLL